MTETFVTATDFRAHVAQITNCIAWRHDRVVVTRHGQEMGALVSFEDLEFLRKYKPLKEKVPSGDVFSPRAIWDEPDGSPQRAIDVPPPPGPDDLIELPDPWEMPLEKLQDLYEVVRPGWNQSPEVMEWWSRATGRLQHEKRRRGTQHVVRQEGGG